MKENKCIYAKSPSNMSNGKKDHLKNESAIINL